MSTPASECCHPALTHTSLEGVRWCFFFFRVTRADLRHSCDTARDAPFFTTCWNVPTAREVQPTNAALASISFPLFATPRCSLSHLSSFLRFQICCARQAKNALCEPIHCCTLARFTARTSQGITARRRPRDTAWRGHPHGVTPTATVLCRHRRRRAPMAASRRSHRRRRTVTHSTLPTGSRRV